jgi:uncharacterized protein
MGYREAIKDIIDTLKRKYHPEKIILFGSCVSGKVGRDSDIDMLIIKDTKKPYGKRWIEACRLVRNIKRHIPFEPFILTPEEIKRELKRNLFLQEIIEKGRVLYEKA